jgi:hypothetical protein
MATRRSCKVQIEPGHNNRERGIGFLIDKSDRHINAKETFDALSMAEERAVRSRFDSWLDFKINDRWYHPFTHPRRKGCFTFKCHENRQEHRLYGFLCNPYKPAPDYQLCVLAIYAAKNSWEADPSELDRIMGLKDNPLVAEAINDLFTPRPGKRR